VFVRPPSAIFPPFGFFPIPTRLDLSLVPCILFHVLGECLHLFRSLLSETLVCFSGKHYFPLLLLVFFFRVLSLLPPPFFSQPTSLSIPGRTQDFLLPEPCSLDSLHVPTLRYLIFSPLSLLTRKSYPGSSRYQSFHGSVYARSLSPRLTIPLRLDLIIFSSSPPPLPHLFMPLPCISASLL